MSVIFVGTPRGAGRRAADGQDQPGGLAGDVDQPVRQADLARSSPRNRNPDHTRSFRNEEKEFDKITHWMSRAQKPTDDMLKTEEKQSPTTHFAQAQTELERTPSAVQSVFVGHFSACSCVFERIVVYRVGACSLGSAQAV